MGVERMGVGEVAALITLAEEHREASALIEAKIPWEGRGGGDERLRRLVPPLVRHEGASWAVVATHIPGRDASECHARWLEMSREQRGGDDDDDGDAAAAEWRSDVLRAAPRAPGALATAMRSRGGDRGSGGGGSGRERLSDAYGSPRAAKRQRSNRDRGGDDDGDDDDDDDDGVTDEARAAADAATRLLRSRIGERQESHGVTQKEVAAAVGVTQSAFSIWFGGRPQSAIMRAKIDAGVATWGAARLRTRLKPRPPPMARAEASASGGGNAAGAETGDDDHGVLNAPMLRRQLTALMAARNLLQKEVAPQIGVHQSALSQWFNARREQSQAMARRVSVAVHEFLEMNPPDQDGDLEEGEEEDDEESGEEDSGGGDGSGTPPVDSSDGE